MALISAGSCLFTGLGLVPFHQNVDPTRVAAQIVTGVGFIGAGSILRQGADVRGLTTAASIWVAAAIGMAIGFGYYMTGAVATVLVLLTLVLLRWVETRFFPSKHNRRRGDPKPEATAL